MILYVAAPSANWQFARSTMVALRRAGHTISVDWTEEVQQYLASGVMVDDPSWLAQRDAVAVRESQAVVWLGGAPTKGAWVELGLALAWNKPVVALARPRPDEIFLFSPLVLLVKTLEDLLATLQRIDPTPTPCPGC